MEEPQDLGEEPGERTLEGVSQHLLDPGPQPWFVLRGSGVLVPHDMMQETRLEFGVTLRIVLLSFGWGLLP